MVTDTIGRLVKDYMEPNTVANANVKDGFTKNQQAVIDGKALFMPNGSWVVAEMEEQLQRLQMGRKRSTCTDKRRKESHHDLYRAVLDSF